MDTLIFASKILFTLFVAVMIWVYRHYYGVQNFLWMSDIGLFLTLAAIWIRSPLIISMCMVGFFLVELVWYFDFVVELITRKSVFGVAHYMFQSRYPLFLRLLSLFHLILPPVWLWLTIDWGYDPRALLYAVPMVWIIFIATYLFTDHAQNINWVFLPQQFHWKRISALQWLLVLCVGYPFFICLPTHLAISALLRV